MGKPVKLLREVAEVRSDWRAAQGIGTELKPAQVNTSARAHTKSWQLQLQMAPYVCSLPKNSTVVREA